MQKGYKRNGKGMAVLHFFIGLIIVAILMCALYFFLGKVDYSDKLANPDATMRAYVEMTAAPENVAVIGGADGPTALFVSGGAHTACSALRFSPDSRDIEWRATFEASPRDDFSLSLL